MPHLSPMNWLLAIISIWLMMFILMSIMWWNTNTKWPKLSTDSPSSMTTLPWNWLL